MGYIESQLNQTLADASPELLPALVPVPLPDMQTQVPSSVLGSDHPWLLHLQAPMNVCRLNTTMIHPVTASLIKATSEAMVFFPTCTTVHAPAQNSTRQ
jgi:hypothetical protein